jgi:putative peptidoglycan lipid II flippase
MDIPLIYSLGAGVFIGGLVQGFVQIPWLIKKGFAPTKPDKLLTKESKKVFKLLGPGLIGFAATQINLIINTVLASGTLVGAVSWLSYGFRMFQLPVGILSVSIGNSNLVHFSDAWKANKKEEAKSLLSSSFFLSVFLVLPPMIGLIIFNDDIIRLVFERGKFDAYATTQTAVALKWYALGLPFYGVYKIFVPTFYAIDRQKVPVYASIFSIIINVIFCVSLTPIYGFEILALGTTVSMLINSCIQMVMLHKDLSLSWSHFLNLRLLKILISALMTFVFCFELDKLLPISTDLFESIVYLGIRLSSVVLCYGVLAFLFGERSVVLSILSKIKNRL